MENEQNTMQKNVENALSVWIMDILITYWQANGPEKYLSPSKQSLYLHCNEMEHEIGRKREIVSVGKIGGQSKLLVEIEWFLQRCHTIMNEDFPGLKIYV